MSHGRATGGRVKNRYGKMHDRRRPFPAGEVWDSLTISCQTVVRRAARWRRTWSPSDGPNGRRLSQPAQIGEDRPAEDGAGGRWGPGRCTRARRSRPRRDSAEMSGAFHAFGTQVKRQARRGVSEVVPTRTRAVMRAEPRAEAISVLSPGSDSVTLARHNSALGVQPRGSTVLGNRRLPRIRRPAQWPSGRLPAGRTARTASGTGWAARSRATRPRPSHWPR